MRIRVLRARALELKAPLLPRRMARFQQKKIILE